MTELIRDRIMTSIEETYIELYPVTSTYVDAESNRQRIAYQTGFLRAMVAYCKNSEVVEAAESLLKSARLVIAWSSK